jgi:hypothetical protein
MMLHDSCIVDRGATDRQEVPLGVRLYGDEPLNTALDPAAPSRFFALHAYRTQLRASGILKTLSTSTAIVLLALADFADPSGRCWPSLARIVADNPVSERSAQRAMRELEDRGLVVREQRPGRSAVVRLVMTSLPKAPTSLQTPATLAPTPAISAGHPRHPGTQNRAGLTEQGSKQQQTKAVDDASGPDVAVSSTKLPQELYDELRQLGVRAPWRLATHGEARIREAIAMMRTAKGVTNPGGWLAMCLAQGWTPAPSPKLSTASEARAEATRAHIAASEQSRAQLADPEQAKRSALAMLAAWASVRPRLAGELAAKLEVRGLTAADWETYQAAQIIARPLSGVSTALTDA